MGRNLLNSEQPKAKRTPRKKDQPLNPNPSEGTTTSAQGGKTGKPKKQGCRAVENLWKCADDLKNKVSHP